ncbi:hypothetical protein BDV97DRAFT_411499 [Delphinella strobiligena]|nr:hypothetical protein BDV97DRAFT_411499 [Delphinella strobiligena]
MTSGSLEQEASEPSAKAATGLQHGPTIQQSQPVRYRQIRSRPTTGSSVVVSAGEGSRDSGQAQITPRRGRRTVAASFLPAGSDPLPLLLPGYNSGPVDLTLTPTRVSLPISGQEARSLRDTTWTVLSISTFARTSKQSIRNGISTILVSLSTETRYWIYKLLLAEDTTLELSTRRNTKTLRVPALLHVNRQIREETSYIWYALNRFTVNLKHGETTLLRAFLVPIACLRSPTIGGLDINLNTCFQCNDLVTVAVLLIASNVPATIKCARGVYHFGHPQVQPCKYNAVQAITDQNFRPSVATALLQGCNNRLAGAGFLIEAESPAERFASSSSPLAKESAVLGYAPAYRINPSIRTHLENAMGSVGLLLQ